MALGRGELRGAIKQNISVVRRVGMHSGQNESIGRRVVRWPEDGLLNVGIYPDSLHIGEAEATYFGQIGLAAHILIRLGKVAGNRHRRIGGTAVVSLVHRQLAYFLAPDGDVDCCREDRCLYEEQERQDSRE